MEADSPHRAWSARLDPAALSSGLRALGHDIGTATAISVVERTASGRVARLQVQGTAGSAVIGGAQATNLLRGLGLKSTRFTVTGALSVRGDGWGHGVGMSQYGARGLAEAGYGFDDILSWYYPGTDLSRLSVVGHAP